jgi:hypothetical protein
MKRHASHARMTSLRRCRFAMMASSEHARSSSTFVPARAGGGDDRMQRVERGNDLARPFADAQHGATAL